ncbi:Nucleus export brr6 [Lecanosticta acicola]|uniref:Nucleus export brr6 n=1 Tax=Lecanosticta acicola TaxID=111012 RepID=A0AAI8YSE8_9PEZI|nr:Nucleus export brr6 [Lecanosticta acicola]
MAHRGHESGMDFEWQNGAGAMDSRSPFAQLSRNTQRYPGTPSGKRSPQKSHTNLTSRTSPAKALPPTPAYNGLFRTPRKMDSMEIDDSSAGETPKSPEQEQQTPDTMGRSARESWMVRFKNKMYSPGRGEVPRGADHEKKISKRRRDRDLGRHISRRRRHSVSDSGEDSEMAKSSRKSSREQKGEQASEKKPHWLSTAFTFIAQHPTVPHILSFYAQLAFNVFLLAGCSYLIYCFWSAVSGDVDKKSHEAMADIMAEMAACAEQYTTNKCDRSTRAPALETVCENWNKCMNRDPSKVGRARVSAHTFAEIFNSFVEPISWKAMIFTFLLVFGCFATTNLAFGFFRDKSNQYYHHQQPPPFYHQGPPPPTPQRSFSNENPGSQYYGTPWSHHVPALEPQPSQGFGQIQGRGSPVRRLVYN